MIIKDFHGYGTEVVINFCSSVIADLGSILVQVQCCVADILPFQHAVITFGSVSLAEDPKVPEKTLLL